MGVASKTCASDGGDCPGGEYKRPESRSPCRKSAGEVSWAHVCNFPHGGVGDRNCNRSKLVPGPGGANFDWVVHRPKFAAKSAAFGDIKPFFGDVCKVGGRFRAMSGDSCRVWAIATRMGGRCWQFSGEFGQCHAISASVGRVRPMLCEFDRAMFHKSALTWRGQPAGLRCSRVACPG